MKRDLFILCMNLILILLFWRSQGRCRGRVRTLWEALLSAEEQHKIRLLCYIYETLVTEVHITMAVKLIRKNSIIQVHNTDDVWQGDAMKNSNINLNTHIFVVLLHYYFYINSMIRWHHLWTCFFYLDDKKARSSIQVKPCSDNVIIFVSITMAIIVNVVLVYK